MVCCIGWTIRVFCLVSLFMGQRTMGGISGVDMSNSPSCRSNGQPVLSDVAIYYGDSL